VGLGGSREADLTDVTRAETEHEQQPTTIKLFALFCIGFISIFRLKIFFAFGLQKAFTRNLKFYMRSLDANPRQLRRGKVVQV